MPASLCDLPAEILSQITCYFPVARDVHHLSLTCRRLHAFVEEEGWRSFVQKAFSANSPPAFWRDAAHALTTRSRNWDRKALVAHRVRPGKQTVKLSAAGIRRPTGQTMGYQPVLDSYEEWIGGDWTSRKEVLACGTGAQLRVQVKTMGDAGERLWREAVDDEERRKFDQHLHHVQWIVYQGEGHKDGPDDITSVNIVRPPQQDPARERAIDTEQIVVGRASGELSLLDLSAQAAECNVIAQYNTGGRPVRSADTNCSSSPLLAASFSDKGVGIYPVKSNSVDVDPIGEIKANSASHRGRIWSTRFLAPTRLAVGSGPTTQPINIYHVGPGGVRQEALRKFSVSQSHMSTHDDVFADELGSSGGTSSVYPIAKLPPIATAGGNEGDLFLSGWYNGVVRLHDLRSPRPWITTYVDAVDTSSAIYSLLPLDGERFLVGGAKHSILKVFDLRMGGKCYSYTDAYSCGKVTANGEPPTHPLNGTRGKGGRCCDWHWENRDDRKDWDVFLSVGAAGGHRRRAAPESPVYSLSTPSLCSPTFFAGVEDEVLQLDAVSIMDSYPDPVFKHGSKGARAPAKHRDQEVKRKWDPFGDALQLAMYEQVQMGQMKLRGQRRVGLLHSYASGWDERWDSGHGFRRPV